MEKKIPFASDVILIDAAFLDRVGKDMAAHFAPLVGRELPKADLAVLLECLASSKPWNIPVSIRSLISGSLS